MITTAINSLITLLIGLLVGFLVSAIKGVGNKRKAETQALKALTHDSYFRMCRYILKNKSELDETDYENFDHLYEAYHSLGLNGLGDKMHEQISEMRLISK